MAGVPFGTKLLINGNVYTVEDLGTPYGHVDIYCSSHSEALSFGLQYADVIPVKLNIRIIKRAVWFDQTAFLTENILLSITDMEFLGFPDSCPCRSEVPVQPDGLPVPLL